MAQTISQLMNAPPVHVDTGHLVTLLHPFHVSCPQLQRVDMHSYPEGFLFETLATHIQAHIYRHWVHMQHTLMHSYI